MTRYRMGMAYSPGVSGEGEETLRVFFALPIDDAVRDRMADVCERLRKGATFTPARLAWVAPENYHLTLHFLGATPAGTARQLGADLAVLAPSLPDFELEFRGLGYFPHPKAPKVLWAGVPHPPRELETVHGAVGRLVEERGLTLKHTNFHAHITLARFKALKGTAAFVKQAAAHARTSYGRTRVERVDLLQSELLPEKARYSAVGSGRLGGRASRAEERD